MRPHDSPDGLTGALLAAWWDARNVAAASCDEAAIERVEWRMDGLPDSLALACGERDAARRWAKAWKERAKVLRQCNTELLT